MPCIALLPCRGLDREEGSCPNTLCFPYTEEQAGPRCVRNLSPVPSYLMVCEVLQFCLLEFLQPEMLSESTPDAEAGTRYGFGMAAIVRISELKGGNYLRSLESFPMDWNV